MHIQTFLLAEKITMRGHRFDVMNAGLCHMTYTEETPWPLCFTLPALIVLSRESASGDVEVDLTFDLLDEDGQRVGRPRGFRSRGVFPHGIWLARLMAKLDFEFPSPGRYRLDISADDGAIEGTHQYNITIKKHEASD